MHTTDEQAGDRGDLFEEITVANVEDLRNLQRRCTLTLTIRHPDVPAGISFGTFYLATTPQRILEAIEASFPQFLRDLETGVSEAGRAALSLDRVWNPVSGAPVGSEGVVRNRGKRR
jgi:hypothetical protein